MTNVDKFIEYAGKSWLDGMASYPDGVRDILNAYQAFVEGNKEAVIDILEGPE